MDFIFTSKRYLEEFNYPNINSLDEFQIAELFSNKNRYSLLCWMVKKISSVFTPSVEPSPEAEQALADFIYESGFCKASERLHFVRGTTDLDVNAQMSIFKRIFDFLHTLNKPRFDSEIIDISTVAEFLKLNVNLFPSNGPLKVYTDKERKEKLICYEKRINELQQAIECSHTKENELHSDIIECDKNHDFNKDHDFNSLLKELKDKVVKLEKVNLLINRHYKKSNNKEYVLENKLVNMIIECEKEVNNFLQLINYETIHKISTNEDKPVVITDELKDMEQIASNLGTIYQDITELKKENSFFK